MYRTSPLFMLPQSGMGFKVEARWPRQRTAAQRQHSRSCESCCSDYLEDDSEWTENVDRLSHSGRLKATEVALAYSEHPSVATAIDRHTTVYAQRNKYPLLIFSEQMLYKFTLC